MPDLIHSLQSRDLGHLRIVAALWGVELTASGPAAALDELIAVLCEPKLAAEVFDALPAEARAALDALAAGEGRLPWAAFVRRFGEIREVGAGHRDREQVYRHPISVTEVLFYRALLARAFFDTPSGAQEFAYIPDDLLWLIYPGKQEEHSRQVQVYVPSVCSIVEAEPLGRPASPKERAHLIPANDRILDDACTLLAALRMGWQTPPNSEAWRYPTDVLAGLLSAAGLVSDAMPQPEAVKNFLAAPRGEALALLARAWLESDTINELRQIPGLLFEGEWKNPARAARNSILAFLARLPKGGWRSLPAFLRAIKERQPDFQRPAGDYDSWFIRSLEGTYLRGFAHWDEVDGALIHYIITGPLHWLGILDLAAPLAEAVPVAFRFTPHAASLLKGEPPEGWPSEEARLHVTSQGRITTPRSLPRAVRYQIARFCAWDAEKGEDYGYRITPRSLERAKRQGLKVGQLLALLRKYAAASLPPAFIRALKRWESKGTEARLESQVVLHLGSPQVLDELRRSKAARFLGEVLGTTTVIVKAGAQAKVLAALVELGLLAEDESQTPESQSPSPNSGVSHVQN